MLSVSFSLALVAAMLFGIVLPGHHKVVDKFNGQTREPIHAGKLDLASGFSPFKAATYISENLDSIRSTRRLRGFAWAKHQ